MAPNGGLAHARGFKSLGGLDSETEFMDYTDDALLAPFSATGLKYETEITDYLRRRIAATDVLAVHAGGGWDPLDYLHNQNDLDSGQALNSEGSVTDGTSNTMLFGERAATPDGRAAHSLK